MKTVLLDPHSSDFIYDCIPYKVAGRKSLKKYHYLDNIDWAYICFSGVNTSLPKSVNEKMPMWLKKVFSFIDLLLWKKLNRVKHEVKLGLKNTDDINVFFFGYKNCESLLRYLTDISFKNNVYIHLSHYHTFDIPEEYFKKLKIIFCFDNDVRASPLFHDKFPYYKKEILILPFSIGQRFFEKNLISGSNRQLKVTGIGTYHMLPKKDSEIIHHGYGTLHPIRIDFAFSKWPNYVDNRLSKYESDSGLIRKIVKGQRKYFRYNIVDVFRESSHVFSGYEGTGAITIGTLEAMASGAQVFISVTEADAFLFDIEEADIVMYGSFSDLKEKIINLDNDSIYKTSIINRELAKNYSSGNLIERAKKILE